MSDEFLYFLYFLLNGFSESESNTLSFGGRESARRRLLLLLLLLFCRLIQINFLDSEWQPRSVSAQDMPLAQTQFAAILFNSVKKGWKKAQRTMQSVSLKDKARIDANLVKIHSTQKREKKNGVEP